MVDLQDSKLVIKSMVLVIRGWGDRAIMDFVTLIVSFRISRFGFQHFSSSSYPISLVVISSLMGVSLVGFRVSFLELSSYRLRC